MSDVQRQLRSPRNAVEWGTAAGWRRPVASVVPWLVYPHCKCWRTQAEQGARIDCHELLSFAIGSGADCPDTVRQIRDIRISWDDKGAQSALCLCNGGSLLSFKGVHFSTSPNSQRVRVSKKSERDVSIL